MNNIQNINLLSSLPVNPKTKLTALLLLKLASLFYLTLILIATIMWSYTAQKKATLNSLLDDKVAVTNAVTGRTMVLAESQAATKNSQGYTQGFSPYLSTLANIVPEGVWLKNIILAENNNITLIGATVDADLITDFLEALNKDPIINATFDTFAIDEANNFTLSTVSEGEKKPE